MKKSVCIIAAFVCAGGLAMAQDAATSKLNLQARLSANAFTVSDLSKASDTLSGVSVPGNDYFGAEYKSDLAGAKISILGTLGNPGTLAIDDFYGWMKFGALKLTFGETDVRYTDRVKNDESSWGTFEKFKYGTLSASAVNTVSCRESDNLAVWKTGEAVADMKFGDLYVAASSGSDDANAYELQNGFGATVGYKLPDTADFDVTFVKYAKNNASVGALAKLLMVKNLSAVAGYSAAYDFSAFDKSVHAAELRARYQMDALAITTHNNLSFGKNSTVVYDMVNVAYKISDAVTAVAYLNNVNTTVSSANGNVLTARPGVTLTATKGATIDVGPEFAVTTTSAATTTKVSLPVVFRVKF